MTLEMLEFEKRLDREILLYINSHHNTYFDSVMWFASSKLSWLPLYVFMIILLSVKYSKRSLLIIVVLLLLVISSDTLSGDILKPLTARLRPSHQPGLENLMHYVNNYRGGLYSFPSSHATNFFAFATYLSLVTARRLRWLPWLLFPVAILVSYSRMYLGVHYPSDVFGGFILGTFLGWLFSKIFFGLSGFPSK